MWAFRSLPVGGADEDFAVAFALLAMKFVDRHTATIFRGVKNSSLLRGCTTNTDCFYFPCCELVTDVPLAGFRNSFKTHHLRTFAGKIGMDSPLVFETLTAR